MASQHLKKKFSKSIQAARALARAFNTLDVKHLHGALSAKAPDAVTSDLLRMGISKSSQFKEQVISVN